MGLDMDFKNIYTGHKDSSGGTNIFASALKAAGCYTPPWCTNQNCTTVVCPQKRGDLLSHGLLRTLLS